MAGKTKNYTEDFKLQIVQLIESGKKRKDVIDEYGVSKSTVDKWCKDYTATKSFKAKDNRTEEEKEIIKLKKELAHAKMENDILKQAALIMGRK